MSKLAKNLVLVTIISVTLLFLCLGFIQYEIFGNCLIMKQNNAQYILISEQDYSKLNNRMQLKILINDIKKNIVIINDWTFENENKIWTAQFDGDSYLSNGNFKLYLKATSLLGF